jgi:DNA-binding MarR family transcriptional regulator/GNAT superfamily N-acetyltransferase
MNSFYQKAGILILGTRMKRLSEKFLQEVNQVYKEKEIPFEPSWFPIFYLLKNGEERSLTEIASELDVSHSAVSQMVSNLKKRGLLSELPDPYDRRRKNICLSEKGKSLLAQIKPVWWALEQTVREVLGEDHRSSFLEQIANLEKEVQDNRFSRDVIAHIPSSQVNFKKIDIKDADPNFLSFLGEQQLEGLGEAHFLGIASVNKEIIGVIILNLMEDTKEYFLQEFFIKNGFRRKGIGSQLLNWAMEELKLSGTACLHLKRVSVPLLALLLKEGKTFKVWGE